MLTTIRPPATLTSRICRLQPVITHKHQTARQSTPTHKCTQHSFIQISDHKHLHTSTPYRSTPTTDLFTTDYKTLKVTQSTTPCPHITVTINREQVHNAFNDIVITEITTVFTTIATHHKSHQLNARAVVLTGSGNKAFSSGADLNWMKSMKQYTYEQNKQDSEKMFDMFYAIHTCPLPTIARINGTALGGGTGLAAVTDMNVAVKDAVFGLTEVRLGLAPAVISKWVIDKIGRANASRYWLTGERFDASAAQRIGLVQHVVDSVDQMDEYVASVLKAVGVSSPQAVSETKKLIDFVATQTEHQACKHYCTDLIAQLRVSDEGQEGLNAFFDKRKPSWMKK